MDLKMTIRTFFSNYTQKLNKNYLKQKFLNFKDVKIVNIQKFRE